MKNKLYIKAIYAILGFLLIGCLFGCESEDKETLNNDLIFTDAAKITVPEYTYLSETDIITVSGDAGYVNGVIDTLTSTPVLRWDSLHVSYIVTAIFNQPIEVKGGVIVNTKDIVWIWHSGLETGKEGFVEYTDGRQIINGDINNVMPPVALPGPATYYWGVWSWGHGGTRILYSSRPLTFFVK